MNPKCDICRCTFEEKPDCYYLINIQNIIDISETKKQICLCQNCIPKILLEESEKVKEIITGYEDNKTDENAKIELEKELNTEIFMDIADDEKAIETNLFNKMQLKTFLKTDFYLRSTSNIVFYTTNNLKIDNFLPFLDSIIVNISNEKNGMRKIIVAPPTK